MKCLSFLAIVAIMSANAAAAELEPLLTIPAESAVADNFDTAHKLDKAIWQQRQGTRWAIEDGVLRGRESSAEYQASNSHHRGFEPRISVPATPDEFAASFSVRFEGDEINAIVPFVEFGHHVCRVRFHAQGLEVLAEGESLVVAKTDNISYEPGRWYHCLAETKDGHFVMQIQNGPTLYAFHESFKNPPSSGGNGLGVAGPKHGIVELDNIDIRNVRQRKQLGWQKTVDGFQTIEPIVIEKARKKFLQKQKAAKQ